MMGMVGMGCSGYAMMPGFGYAGSLWAYNGLYPGYVPPGLWAYNSWYGMFSFMPCDGMIMSPYGYQYLSPALTGNKPTNGPSGPTGPIHPVRQPGHRPTLALASQAARRPLALAVNGFSAPGYHAGMYAASGYRSSTFGGGGYNGSGYIGSTAAASSVSASSGFSGAVSRGGGSVGTAVSSSSGGGGRR
jgi:hypothetical protein